MELFVANLLEADSYDTPFKGCSAILHAGTPMGYGGADSPREVYDGAINGTKSVLKSAKKVGTVKRFIYTSSFSAIHHPMKSGYVFSEKDLICFHLTAQKKEELSGIMLTFEK